VYKVYNKSTQHKYLLTYFLTDLLSHWLPATEVNNMSLFWKW